MSSSDIIEATRPLIRLLEQHAIRYYIGGSVASSAHGLPRTTIDVDIVVDLKHSHVETIVAALENSFYIDRDLIHQAIDNETSFNIIHLETFIDHCPGVSLGALRPPLLDSTEAGVQRSVSPCPYKGTLVTKFDDQQLQVRGNSNEIPQRDQEFGGRPGSSKTFTDFENKTLSMEFLPSG